ncbi:MAG TPA: saccharopine dehydrogenase NADP-binding domain-containing protein [Polyangiales bacterium]|nr:saccharopine dehydrogenase NADP-binding domain-containing protein [Polyangiales bacterium]
MTKVLLLGAGNIGVAIAELLTRSGDYEVTVADRDQQRLSAMPQGVPTVLLDVTDRAALRRALSQTEAVISACPYFLNVPIAETARETSTHYFDLTEDVATANRVRELAEGSRSVFVPQCGLAPGFISIAAHDLAKRFDKLNRVRMRVGALPLFPSNALKYNLTWSTAGLINEYCNPCHVIHDGEVREVLALEGLEEFSLDGVTYEAFNTSGGLGTLWETLRGKVDYLNYKTIRYPGHCELIKFLCNDLRLCERRKLFEDVLEHAVPVTAQDVVLIFVTVSGLQNGRLVQETYTRKVYHGRIGGVELSAIQITTAAGVCAILDLQRTGSLPSAGFIRQEDVPLQTFLKNRFGQYYA